MPALLRQALSRTETQPLTTPPIVGEAGQRNLIKSLGARSMSGTESSASISESVAVDNLRGTGRDELVRRLRDVLDMAGQADGGLESANLRGTAVDRAAATVDKLIDGKVNEMDMDERMTLEALVRLNDRPSFRVNNDNIDPQDPLFGEWGGFLIGLVQLPQLIQSVGRIDINGAHAGTGFVVAPGLVMTNRHVLEAIADRIAGPSGERWLFGSGQATIDFSDTADGSRQFRIDSVVATGANAINSVVNFKNLDMALLQVDTAGTSAFPAAIDPVESPIVRGEMFTIGYPARPGTSSMIDPETGQFSIEISKRIGAIFNADFGRKYVSPGAIETPIGQLSGDSRDWVFAHDATTFGGNSGSCIVQIGSQVSAMGLHFAGATLTANYGHGLSAIKAARPELFDGLNINWI